MPPRYWLMLGLTFLFTGMAFLPALTGWALLAIFILIVVLILMVVVASAQADAEKLKWAWKRRPNQTAQLKSSIDYSQNLNAQANTAQSKIYSQVFAQSAEYINDIKLAAGIASGELGVSLTKISANIAELQTKIKEDCSQFSQVSRFFTYYIPEIAKLVRLRGSLPESVRSESIIKIDQMLSRLAALSKDFINFLGENDVRELEIDLKLLDQSLNQEVYIDISNEKAVASKTNPI